MKTVQESAFVDSSLTLRRSALCGPWPQLVFGTTKYAKGREKAKLTSGPFAMQSFETLLRVIDIVLTVFVSTY